MSTKSDLHAPQTADAKEMMHSIVAQVRYVSSVPRAERERALKCLLLRPLRVSMPGGGGNRVSAFAMLSAGVCFCFASAPIHAKFQNH